MMTLADEQNQANLRAKLGDRPIRNTVYSRVAEGAVFHARLFAQADDAGADGFANVPRPSASSLIWQNPKSTLRHLPQRHLR